MIYLNKNRLKKALIAGLCLLGTLLIYTSFFKRNFNTKYFIGNYNSTQNILDLAKSNSTQDIFDLVAYQLADMQFDDTNSNNVTGMYIVKR